MFLEEQLQSTGERAVPSLKWEHMQVGAVGKKKNTGRIADPAFDFSDWKWKLISIYFFFIQNRSRDTLMFTRWVEQEVHHKDLSLHWIM